MIRIMSKIWVQEGLDMRMVIFRCFSTGRGRGQSGVGGVMAGQLLWGVSLLNALLPFLHMNCVLLQKNEKGRIIPLETMEWHKKRKAGRETHKIKQIWRHSNHVYCVDLVF